MNGKNPPSSASPAPSQDGSPLTETPVLSKLSSLQSDIAGQQFKSPRLQQLLGNRTSAAGSLNASGAVKSSDSVEPAENEAGVAEVAAIETSDKVDETLDVAEAEV